MEEFEQKILELIEEREKNLFEIERTLFTKRYKLSQIHFEIFAVQSITMIYAIWEGFGQRAFQLYISKLNSLNVDFKDFNSEIKTFHLENTFKQFNEYPQKEQKKYAFFEDLYIFNRQDKHNLYPKINTQSNLGFKTLNVILKALCLEPFTEWHTYQYPNQSLEAQLKMFLEYRNGIAHGGDISSNEKVTQAIYTKYKDLVVTLMYAIMYKMIDGLNNESYKITQGSDLSIE